MPHFSLSPIKQEGTLYIGEEWVEDSRPLPKLPNKHICSSVNLAGKVLSREEYTKEYIKSQKWF